MDPDAMGAALAPEEPAPQWRPLRRSLKTPSEPFQSSHFQTLHHRTPRQLRCLGEVSDAGRFCTGGQTPSDVQHQRRGTTFLFQRLWLADISMGNMLII